MATNYNFGIRLAVEGEGAAVVATDKVGKGFTDLGGRASQVEEITSGLIGKLGALAGAYLSAASVREFIRTADAMNAMDGRLRNVVGSTADFNIAQKELYDISQRNNVALLDSTTLFTRIYDPIVKMGGGVQHATTMVDALSTGLRINKATQAEASSAILQFSQSMASGVLRGEEFNAVNEAAPPFMRALAQALGVTSGELRAMAKDGQLTADVVGNAMPVALRLLEVQAAGLPDTIGGAFQRVKNDAALLVQQLDTTTGSSSALTEMLSAGSAAAKLFSGILRDNAASAAIAGQGFDGVGLAIRVVGTIAETVLVLMANVSFTLQGIGREAGGLAAQVAAVVQGNFAEAKRIGAEMRADADAARAQVDKYSASVLGMTDRVLSQRAALQSNSLSASENTAEMLKLGRQNELTGGGLSALHAATNKQTDAQKAAAAAAEAAAKEHMKLLDSYVKIVDGLADKVRADALADETQRKLSDTERAAIKIMDDISAGRVKLTELIQNGTIASLGNSLAIDENNRLAKEAAALAAAGAAATAAATKENEKHLDAIVKKNAGLADEILKQQASNDELAGNKQALADNTIEKYLANAASAERAAMVALERNEDIAQYEALMNQAQAYRDLAALKADEVPLKIAKEARQEWEKTATSIENGLTDSLFRAFESGKGFFKTLWDGLVNTFKTTILKPIIQDTVKDFIGWFKSGASLVDTTILKPTFSTSGISAFLDAFASGFKSLLSWLDNALGGVLSGIWNGIGSLMSSIFGGGGGGIGGGVTGAISGASNLNTLWGAASQAWAGGAAGASAASLGYANLVGAAGGDALGALIAGNGGWAGVGASTGATGTVSSWLSSLGLGGTGTGAGAGAAAGGAAAGGGTAAGAAAGIGAAAALGVFAMALYGIATHTDDPLNDAGGEYVVTQQGLQKLGVGTTGEVAGADVSKAIAGTAVQINAMLEALGSKERLDSFQAGLRTSDGYGAPSGGVYAGGRFVGGGTFGEARAAVATLWADPGYQQAADGSWMAPTGNNLYERTSSQEVTDQAELLSNFSADLLQAMIQALQAVGDLPAEVGAYVASLGDAESMTQADAAAALAHVVELNQAIAAGKKQKQPTDPIAQMDAGSSAEVPWQMDAGSSAEVPWQMDQAQPPWQMDTGTSGAASAAAAAASGDAIVTELQALRQQVNTLQADARRTADMLQRATRDGPNIYTVAA